MESLVRRLLTLAMQSSDQSMLFASVRGYLGTKTKPSSASLSVARIEHSSYSLIKL